MVVSRLASASGGSDATALPAPGALSAPAMVCPPAAQVELAPMLQAGTPRIHSDSREFLKCVALLSMLADHIGVIFLPNIDVLRYIGRLAFPIYAYLVATGFVLTRNPDRYFLRLAGLALLSQIGFGLFHHDGQRLNVIFLFALAVAVLRCWQQGRAGKVAAILVAGLVFFDLEYGWQGLLTVIAFYLLRTHKILGSTLFMAAMVVPHFVYAGGTYHVLSVLALPVILAAPRRFPWRVPNWLWRGFYPLHWYPLWLLRNFLVM